MKRLLASLFFCFFVGNTLICRADQPACTGDRHYDGVACCPATTTSTTLPSKEECPTLVCPEPQPCQPVVCQDGADGTTTVVEVDRCPEVKFPAYVPCKSRPKGKAREGDIIVNGRAFKCPRKSTPNRYFIPFSL